MAASARSAGGAVTASTMAPALPESLETFEKINPMMGSGHGSSEEDSVTHQPRPRHPPCDNQTAVAQPAPAAEIEQNVSVDYTQPSSVVEVGTQLNTSTDHAAATQSAPAVKVEKNMSADFAQPAPAAAEVGTQQNTSTDSTAAAQPTPAEPCALATTPQPRN